MADCSPKYPEFVESVLDLTTEQLDTFVDSLEPEEATALICDWNLWALPYQRMPVGNWRRWVFRAGRGTGKTHTGARTTNEVARDRQKIRTGEIGIVGRTHADARHTMVEGPSGILAQAPIDFQPTWEPGNGILTWPNGVKGRIFSADKPEQMRGPNFAWIWADEPAHWHDGENTWWEVIEPALRIGWARCMLTSTPIAGSFLKDLEAKFDTVVTRASTFENCFLPQRVRDLLREHYAGTRRGRQELDGEYLTENEKALWKQFLFEQARLATLPCDMKRIVVAVDPAVTANANSDETGIVVCGLGTDGHGYVLADRSGIYTPAQWGRTALAAYARFKADAIVAEVNNGGDLVVSNIHGINDKVSVKPVRATRGKVVRAEPVSALYERAMIHHVGLFAELETQCTEWDPSKSKSPDRLDALVWGITDLMLVENDSVGPLVAYL
jgi:phage terminase large subunit-like protein